MTWVYSQEYQKKILESIEEKVAIWKRIAKDLEKPSRKRRFVNLNKLNNVTTEGDVVIIPGKVLGDGEIQKNLTVIAYQFSNSAIEKLTNSKSKIMNISELMNKNPKGQKIKIIG